MYATLENVHKLERKQKSYVDHKIKVISDTIFSYLPTDSLFLN